MTIYIYLDGKIHGMRQDWPQCPRIGEKIVINFSKTRDTTRRMTTVKVVEVIWGDGFGGDANKIDVCQATIYCVTA